MPLLLFTDMLHRYSDSVDVYSSLITFEIYICIDFPFSFLIAASFFFTTF